jgi:hypothetical protein
MLLRTCGQSVQYSRCSFHASKEADASMHSYRDGDFIHLHPLHERLQMMMLMPPLAASPFNARQHPTQSRH